MRADKNQDKLPALGKPSFFGFDGGSLCCAYVSELTTLSTDYRHQCLQHFAHCRAINLNKPTMRTAYYKLCSSSLGHT